MKIYDKIVQWKITIEGVDEEMKPLVGGRCSITKAAFEDCEFRVEDREFQILWRNVIEKAKKEDLK